MRDKSSRAYEILCGASYEGYPHGKGSDWDKHKQILSAKVNFLLPGKRSLDKRLPAPLQEDGPQTHEILAAICLAEYHGNTSCTIESDKLLIVNVALPFDGKMLNLGVELVGNQFVGLRNIDGTRTSIEQMQQFHAIHKGVIILSFISLHNI